MPIARSTGAGPRAAQTSKAPSIEVAADVPFDAPWGWLAAGWRDLWSVPAISLGYGAVFAVCAIALAYGLTLAGWQSLMPALAGGFLLLGPMLAVGLYEVSRRRETGEAIDIRDIILVGVRSPGELLSMGLALLIAYLAWVRIAMLLLLVFLGTGALPPPEDFMRTLLFTPEGLGLLVVGTAAGAVLAALVFAASAISVPLLMVRDVDVVTAVVASFKTVLRNPRPMALWAALIAALVAFGIATLCIGLAVAFPLIGHATWHAFRSAVRLEAEPEIVPDVTRR
jgi:uncharacterized membrane protein